MVKYLYCYKSATLVPGICSSANSTVRSGWLGKYNPVWYPGVELRKPVYSSGCAGDCTGSPNTAGQTKITNFLGDLRGNFLVVFPG
jgi:hypothetical protein